MLFNQPTNQTRKDRKMSITKQSLIVRKIVAENKKPHPIVQVFLFIRHKKKRGIKVNRQDVKEGLKMGDITIRKAINKLIEYGYVESILERRANGKIKRSTLKCI